MKAEVRIDSSGYINIQLVAETAEDAAGLVRHAMNANKDTRCWTHTSVRQSISMSIGLGVRRDREGSPNTIVRRQS